MTIFNQFVTDMKRDAQFYHGTMKFPLFADVPLEDGEIVLLDAGTAYLSLIRCARLPDDVFPTVLTVADDEQKIAALKANGYREIYEPIRLPLCVIRFTESPTGTKGAWVRYDDSALKNAAETSTDKDDWMEHL